MVQISKAQATLAFIILMFMLFGTDIPGRLYRDHSAHTIFREGTLILVLMVLALLISKVVKYSRK